MYLFLQKYTNTRRIFELIYSYKFEMLKYSAQVNCLYSQEYKSSKKVRV